MNIKDIIDCSTHPVKNRIILEVHNKGECTAKELLSILSDIPQATLYRILNNLTEKGILKVVAENKIRAMTERVYAVNEEVFQIGNPLLEENNGEAYFKMFSIFTMGLMKEFHSYAKRTSINILEDGSGFSATTIYATTEELMEIGQKIKEIIVPYQKKNPSADGQKMHNLATIITPPTE